MWGIIIFIVLELGFTVVREKAVREFAAGEKGAYSAAKTAEVYLAVRKVMQIYFYCGRLYLGDRNK